MTDWESSETHVLQNPRTFSKKEEEALLSHGLRGHLWVSTSGSTKKKWVALSKEAFLCSAEAVNSHLEVTPGDIWVNPLPLFHVGGLGILARAHVKKNAVRTLEQWAPGAFRQLLEGATLSALVPTQLYDLVEKGLTPPSSLRAVVIGGGALNSILRQQAELLGWPIRASYGMTECASQVATEDRSGIVRILPHVSCRLKESLLEIQSAALLTAYALEGGEKLYDPKESGWFLTEDRAHIEGDALQIFGRGADYVKVNGEGVCLPVVEENFAKFFAGLFQIVPCEDPRMGARLCLAAQTCPEEAVMHYNKSAPPFERLHGYKIVEEFPKNSVGKLLRKSVKPEEVTFLSEL